MTTRYRFLAALIGGLLLPGAAQAQTFFAGALTPAQEPHDVTSGGSGTVAAVLTDEGLRYIVSVDSLTGPIQAAHFHQGATGVGGGVVHGITDSFDGQTATGVWAAGDDEPLTDELVAALMGGELYVNVHTEAFGAGEVRAQLRPVSGAGLSAMLTPEQETHDVTSEGMGTAALQATPDGVLYYLTVSGLTGDIAAAHFHDGDLGANGGVVKGITDSFDGTTAFGVWTADDDEGPLTDELMAELLTGGLYLNVHTAEFGAGEVRGQVLLTSGWGFSATLTPDQEVHDVTSDGMGTASLTLTDLGLVYRITVEGLTGPLQAAHFHNAPAGADGGVVRGITDSFSGSTARGVWMTSGDGALTEDLITELLAGNLYLNVHTAAFGSGEIRGQVLADAGTSLAAQLSPEQEVHDVTSNGTGTAALTLTDEGLAYSITVDSLTGDIAAAHFHQGAAGVDGGVVKTLTDSFDGTTATGVWGPDDDEPLTDELVAALLTGGLYLNVHTAEFGAGEVRGQVHVTGGTALRATLTPEQETHDVTSDGMGTAALTLTDDGLVYRITVEGLTGDIAAAHFHQGAAGVDGGVVKTLTDSFDGTTATGVWGPDDDEPLTDELVAALLTGRLYLNVHTAEFGAGEVRGQIVLGGGVGAAVQLDPEQEPHDVTSDGAGTAALVLTPSGLVYRTTVAELTGPVQAAHFHQAPLGQGGGVVHGITDAFSGPTAAGVWGPDDDAPLTPELLQAFFDGDLYLNVHTEAFGAGEVRGQINPGEAVLTSIEPVGGAVPERFRLEGNYPNPFNPQTTITFAMPAVEHARLDVFDALGRRVATLLDGPTAAGTYRVAFDGRGLPSGLYLYRLTAGGHQETRTMVLLK